MSGNSSRKPSGSSTHSVAHSPMGSPRHHGQAHLNPASAANMYAVGMSNANSLKGLNSGWQVWGPGAQSSRRNASISSATSVTELHTPQTDSSYRGNITEGWSVSRPASGAWDEGVDGPQKHDFASVESHAQLNLHHARPRQSAVIQPAPFSGVALEDRPAPPKAGQFSPQRYDAGLGKEPTGSRFASSTSPTRSFGANTYPTHQSASQGAMASGLEVIPSVQTVNEDLSYSLRGMAVEDDFQVQPNRQPLSHLAQHGRGPPVPLPHPYNLYPQSDYTPYYSLPPVRDSYVDYPYGYEAYRVSADTSMYTSPVLSGATTVNLYPPVTPQAMHPTAIPDVHRPQPGMFYDPHRPTSQFYYPPHQPILYPQPSPSPLVTSQMHTPLTDKKHDIPYNLQQQLSSSGLLYGAIRSTPSPNPYLNALDYGSQLPVMLPGRMYGPNPLHLYAHAMRGGRRGNHESSNTLRSPLLDEFRSNKTRKWELRDIFGFIVEFSGDQHGSRFIQQKLETATSEEKQIVFDEIVPNNTLQLIQDVFGNYLTMPEQVVQKLFEHGTQVQKTVLAGTMEGHILSLSLQMYGCRVVQKAIEYVLPDQQSTIVHELEPHVLRCVKDSNGNHVIQKLIERVSPDRLGFISVFRGNVYDLATHPYGCRVLQRCLEHLPEDVTRPLLDELHKYTVNLMQDQFGNYVVQYVLEHGKPHDRVLVIAKIRGQLLQLARHKFASNVCEKALLCADSEGRRILIDEIMTPKHDSVSPIVTMMKDQYANYVLQRALTVVEGDQREILVAKVKTQLVTMRRYSSSYTKHLLSIERLIEKYSTPDQAPQVNVTTDQTR